MKYTIDTENKTIVIYEATIKEIMEEFLNIQDYKIISGIETIKILERQNPFYANGTIPLGATQL